MNRNPLFVIVMAGAFLAACESGDINITPTTVDNSVDNSTGGGGGGSDDDICASYVRDGTEVSGSADGNGNCTYDSTFVGPKNNLQEDLLIEALPDGGAHIFTSSLFVGNTYRTQQELMDAGISAGRHRSDADRAGWRNARVPDEQGFHHHQSWLANHCRRPCRRTDHVHVCNGHQRHRWPRRRAAVGRYRDQRLRRQQQVQLRRVPEAKPVSA